MNEQEQIKLLIKGMIAEMSEDEQTMVRSYYNDIKEVLDEGGQWALLALTLHGAEAACNGN